MSDVDLLVVGSGVAGATAAHALSATGASVLVLEKSRGLGGRCATRRLDGGVRIDHGAQYVTARDNRFRARLEAWRATGEVAVWTQGVDHWTRTSGLQRSSGGGHARYVAPEGMSRLGALMLGDVAVTRKTRVASVVPDASAWRVVDENGVHHHARAVLLTPPAPQALDLVDRADVDAEAWDAMASIRYAPSFALMTEHPGPMPDWRGIQVEDHPVLSWIANDTSKRPQSQVRHVPFAVVAHGTPSFVRERFDDDPAAVTDEMAQALVDVTGLEAPNWKRLHRWRYAMTETPLERPFARLAPGLLAAGDGFGSGRVEGAFLSGAAAADALIDHLGPF